MNIRQSLWLMALAAIVSACSNHPDSIHITGKFSHLDQGEFLIYSSDGAIEGMDSLHIRDGRFDYDLTLEQNATLHILYPNFSQLTVFASAGDDITIEGDAQNLSEVTVKGSKDNELFTAMRKEIKGQGDSTVLATARNYALANPSSALSRYILRTYFLQNKKASRQQVTELYDSLMRSNPEDAQLGQLSAAVRNHHRLDSGLVIPPFQLQLRGNEFTKQRTDSIVSDTTFRGKHLLMIFWATWYNGSRTALFYARQHRNKTQMKGQAILSYSLDYSAKDLASAEVRDSISYASYCDFQSLSSPLAKRWGITELPFYIYIDPKGKIIASGCDWKKDIEPRIKYDSEK